MHPSAGEHWLLSDQPLISILPVETAEVAPIASARHGLRLSNGTIVIADFPTSELKVFGADGRYVRTFGRKGGGPGEFRWIERLYRMPGDSMAVWSTPRFVVFDSAGRFVRQEVMDMKSSGTGEPYGWVALPTRAMFVVTQLADNDGLRNGLDRPAMDYHITLPDGSMTPLVRSPGIAQLIEKGVPLGGPLFHVTTEFAMSGSRLYIGDNLGDTIHIFDHEGTRLAPVVLTQTPREPTDAEREAVANRLLDRARRLEASGRPMLGSVADYERILPKLKAMSRYPKFRTLHSGPDQELWVEEYAPVESRQRWLVFDSTSRLTGMVLVPQEFKLFDVGRDYILGATRDAFDRDEIRLYGLTRADPNR